MHTFLDGPAKGTVLTCQRAPLFLRVVIDPNGVIDALDSLADTPAPDEKITVYFQVGNKGSVHYSGRNKDGKRFGRFEEVADYAVCQEQPDDETARNATAWRAWCEGRAEKLKAAEAVGKE